MDEAKVLELAAQVGIDMDAYDDQILAFARLVAAAERERLYHEAIKQGISAMDSYCRLIGQFGATHAIRSRTE